jgi:hypothetical protein
MASTVDVANGDHLASRKIEEPLEDECALIADADAREIDAIAGGGSSKDR